MCKQAIPFFDAPGYNLGWMDATSARSTKYNNWTMYVRVSQTETGGTSRIFRVRQIGDVISVDANVGCNTFYQWGRKDPFPGSQANGSSSTAKTYPADVITNTGGTAQSMSYAILHPTVFISATSYKYDWNTTTDGTLWGEESTKTVNDPCPAGYRVPTRDWVSIYTGTGSSITGWALDLAHYWLKVGSPVTVFPITGYREEGGSLDHVTDRFILWNARQDGAYSAPEGKGYSMYFDTTDSSKSATGKARGGVIRCVAE